VQYTALRCCYDHGRGLCTVAGCGYPRMDIAPSRHVHFCFSQSNLKVVHAGLVPGCNRPGSALHARTTRGSDAVASDCAGAWETDTLQMHKLQYTRASNSQLQQQRHRHHSLSSAMPLWGIDGPSKLRKAVPEETADCSHATARHCTRQHLNTRNLLHTLDTSTDWHKQPVPGPTIAAVGGRDHCLKAI
jgi:hypothetical protein